MHLQNFCKVKENSLSPEMCDAVIETFNNNTELHERYDSNKRPNFTQFNFTKHRDRNVELHDAIAQEALKAIAEYKYDVKETFFWSSKYSFEQFRVKHYLNDGNDQFDTHIDASTYETSKRFFAFFWYLNDVEEGGETEFATFSLKIKPKKGTLFMFPPLWMYPHKGNPPISNDKYLLSSYLHHSAG
jgi:hypothetical protein